KQRSLPGLEKDSDVTPPAAATKQKRAKKPADSTQASEVAPQPSNATSKTATHCPPKPQAIDIKGWNVYIVDAHSLIFQVFHALPEMSSPRGEQVGAVFGFVRDMLYLIEDKKPDALICAFDLSGPTFRDEIYDAYKAERGEMPEELVGQIPKI